MHARVGDVIEVSGHDAESPIRMAEVLELRGERGEPPYYVRWLHDDHEGLYFPGTNAMVLLADSGSFRG